MPVRPCFGPRRVWHWSEIGYTPNAAHAEQLFPGIGAFGGLFFKTRADLDLSLGPHHALAPAARSLGAQRPMIALEPIGTFDVAGRVRDLTFGEGYLTKHPRTESTS